MMRIVMTDMINECAQKGCQASQQEGFNTDDEPLFYDELYHQARVQPKKAQCKPKRQSMRTGVYTEDEDKLLYEEHMTI